MEAIICTFIAFCTSVMSQCDWLERVRHEPSGTTRHAGNDKRRIEAAACRTNFLRSLGLNHGADFIWCNRYADQFDTPAVQAQLDCSTRASIGSIDRMSKVDQARQIMPA